MTIDSEQGYELTATAEDELREILQWIGDHDGLSRALHIHGKFVEAFELLALQPNSGTRRRKTHWGMPAMVARLQMGS